MLNNFIASINSMKSPHLVTKKCQVFMVWVYTLQIELNHATGLHASFSSELFTQNNPSVLNRIIKMIKTILSKPFLV